MKVFAMLMLRCALLMLLSSLLKNGTLATLGEWKTSCQKLKEWKESCHLWVSVISISLGSITSDDLSNIPNINHSLDVLLYDVNKFPLEGMDELLDRRLQKPLKMAISNCNKLLNEVEHSGREDNKKYLESLVSKTSSIAKGLRTEFNTFIFEVELELLTKFYRTLQNRGELGNKLLDFVQLSTNSYIDVDYFTDAWFKLSNGMGNNPRYEPGTPEFVDFVESLILNAKLNILKNEMSAKIAGFVEQQHFDWNGFMEFSHNFKREWNQIEQQIDQVSNRDIADIMERYRTELDDLAQNAMKETAKGIITKVQQNFYVMLMPNSTPTTFYQILKVTKKLGEMKNEDQIWLNLADSKMFFTILYDLTGLKKSVQKIKIKKEPENQFCVLAHFVEDLLEEMASGNKIPKIESIEVAIGHFISVKEELCKEKSIEKNLKIYFAENLVNFGKAINIDGSPYNELHQIGRELVKEIEEMLQNGDNWNYAYLNSSKMDEWNLLEYDLRKTGNDQKWEEIEQLRGEWQKAYNKWIFNKETEKKPNFEQMMTNLIKILRNFIMPLNVREIVKHIEQMPQNEDWDYAYYLNHSMDEWNFLQNDLHKLGNDQKWDEIEQLRGELKKAYSEEVMKNLIKILRDII